MLVQVQIDDVVIERPDWEAMNQSNFLAFIRDLKDIFLLRCRYATRGQQLQLLNHHLRYKICAPMLCNLRNKQIILLLKALEA